MYFNPATIVVAFASLATAVPFDLLSSSSSRALAERDFESQLNTREPAFVEERDDQDLWEREDESVYSELEKRRGGGGGGGKGGGGGGGSSSGGSKGGSSGSSGSSGGSRSSPGVTSAPKGFGGGSTFAGGSRSSFVPGRSSGSISPVFLAGGAGLGLGLVAGAAVWSYPYHNYYNYHNNTRNKNSSLPVQCFCEQYNPCGCGETDNATVTQMLKNSSVANIKDVNGTQTVVVNGTLPNGTDTDTSAAMSLHRSFSEQGGFLAMVAIVVGMVVF